jgi:hypothetical protein
MIDYNCKICGNPDHFFFRWSTSRYFNRRKVLDIVKQNSNLRKFDRESILKGEYRVCGKCCEKYNIMER